MVKGCSNCESWKIRYGWLNVGVTVFLVVVAAYILFSLPATLESECCRAYNVNKEQCFMKDKYELFTDAEYLDQGLLGPEQSISYSYDDVYDKHPVVE